MIYFYCPSESSTNSLKNTKHTVTKSRDGFSTDGVFTLNRNTRVCFNLVFVSVLCMSFSAGVCVCVNSACLPTAVCLCPNCRLIKLKSVWPFHVSLDTLMLKIPQTPPGVCFFISVYSKTSAPFSSSQRCVGTLCLPVSLYVRSPFYWFYPLVSKHIIENSAAWKSSVFGG